jgi:hypothetical protein
VTNQIFLGYNPGYTFSPFGNTAPGLYGFDDGSLSAVASNNVEFGIRNGDPCSGTIICTDPLLLNEPAQTGAIPPETALDVFTTNPSTSSFHLTSSSPARSAGTTPCPATDYFNTSQTSPCTIGAVVFGSAPPTTGPIAKGQIVFKSLKMQ